MDNLEVNNSEAAGAAVENPVRKTAKPRRKKTNEEKLEKIFSRPKNKVSQKTEVKENIFKQNKKVLLWTVAGIVLVSLIATSAYFFWQYKKAMDLNPGRTEAAGYVAKIGKFLELPDEEPTLATIADQEKLKDNAFFAKAENGDKVLIFSKAQKAILFRPSTGKVIEIAGLPGAVSPQPQAQDIGVPEAQNEAQEGQQAPAEAQNEPEKAPEAQKLAKIAVYNGTLQKGLAKSISDKLAASLEVEITMTGNAKGNYEKTSVIDLSGNMSDVAKTIAEKLGGEVGTLPDGEQKPESDILVIGGADFKTE